MVACRDAALVDRPRLRCYTRLPGAPIMASRAGRWVPSRCDLSIYRKVVQRHAVIVIPATTIPTRSYSPQ